MIARLQTKTELKFQTRANGVTYYWMAGCGRVNNPPNTIYEHSAWCKSCEKVRPKEDRNCHKCGRQLRHSSRHSKKDVKRI